MDTSKVDSRFVVPQPRSPSKPKRRKNSKKRSSAPSQSLAQGISNATAQLKQSKNVVHPSPPIQLQSSHSGGPGQTPQSDDLLGLFDPSPPVTNTRPAFGNSVSQPHPHQNPFEFFDPLQPAKSDFFGSNLSTPGTSKRSSVASNASSIDDGALFDPNMWELSSVGSNDFFEAEAAKATPSPGNSPDVGLVMQPFDETREDDAEPSEESQPDEDDDGDDDEAEPGAKKGKEDSKEEEVEEPPTNTLVELHRGTALLKYPRRHGFPHFKHVQLSQDNRRIQWFSKRKNLADTCIRVSDIREIRTGQKTETFLKFHQEVLEKASFSVVFGDNYRTFDVVAKSTDECNMWVKSLRKLKDLSSQGENLDIMTHMDVGIAFKDRNRPKSRQGSGNFVRANNSRQLKIDPVAMKQIERDMDGLRRNYARTVQLSNRPNIARSHEYDNISQVLSELEERIEELTHEVNNTRDTDMSKRDVWRANVDLTAITEKVEVLMKVFDSNGRMKR